MASFSNAALDLVPRGFPLFRRDCVYTRVVNIGVVYKGNAGVVCVQVPRGRLASSRRASESASHVWRNCVYGPSVQGAGHPLITRATR